MDWMIALLIVLMTGICFGYLVGRQLLRLQIAEQLSARSSDWCDEGRVRLKP